MVAIAVLDDYQNVALRMADWSGLQKSHRVVVFNERLTDVDAAARALADFDVIVHHARAHAVPARAVREAAQAEAAGDDRQAQRLDRSGGRQGPQAWSCAARAAATAAASPRPSWRSR